MPILFDYLAQICAKAQGDGKDPPGVDRVFYALETYCETLEEGLLPYLPALLEHLLIMRGSKYSTHVQELALSVIGSASSSVKTGILPFFPRVFEHLKYYLIEASDPEDVCLQVQAVG